MTEIEVVYSAIQIGLGALIGGGFSYINSSLNLESERRGTLSTRRRDHLEKILELIAELENKYAHQKLYNYQQRNLSMKNQARSMLMSLALFMVAVSPASADASLTLVGGNTIYGGQTGPVNDFGVAGTIQGLATGDYSFSFTRTPHNFTTQNLQVTANGSFWSNLGSPHITFLYNTPNNFSISGIVPYGVECGEYEDVIIKIYNSAGQLVISNPVTIQNPTHQAPLTNFKINNSSAQPPTAIVVSNTFSPAITLTYTGTGTVTTYRVYLFKAYANGAPVPGGPTSDTSWHNGPVPATINVRNLGGGTFVANQLAVAPGYYGIKMETQGGICAYVGAASRSALILTTTRLIRYNYNQKYIQKK